MGNLDRYRSLDSEVKEIVFSLTVLPFKISYYYPIKQIERNFCSITTTDSKIIITCYSHKLSKKLVVSSKFGERMHNDGQNSNHS